MPSGYTEKVLKGADFKEFATTCARAFGALIEMRDDSLDAPIPDKIEDTDSKYHADNVAKAEKKLKSVKKMSLSRAFKAAAKDYKANRASLLEGFHEAIENQRKLSSVLKQAEAYVPPSPDHVNFKKFMIDQLTETMRYDGSTDYYDKALKELRQLTPQEYKAEQIKSATRDITYHKEEMEKSKERNADRNKWLAQLKASLK